MLRIKVSENTYILIVMDEIIIIKIFIGTESKTKMRKKSNMIYRYENIKIELCTDIKCKVGMTEN